MKSITLIAVVLGMVMASSLVNAEVREGSEMVDNGCVVINAQILCGSSL